MSVTKCLARTFAGLMLFLLMGGLLLSPPMTRTSCGTVFNLSDQNSTVSVDTQTQAGAFSWNVDGVSQLYQQWFWFRVGNTPEASLDTLPVGPQGVNDTNFDGFADTLFARYTGSTYRVDVRYGLAGGTPGSGASDMAEQITITNLGSGNLDFHFFQYTDFDLQGASGNDTAVFTNVNTVRQSNGASRLTETVVTPSANHREINFYPTTRSSLNDGVATTLIDNPIGVQYGPGDITWAFQWDFSIAPNTSVQISKDKNLSITVPEPGSLTLCGLAAGLLLFYCRRRRRSLG